MREIEKLEFELNDIQKRIIEKLDLKLEQMLLKLSYSRKERITLYDVDNDVVWLNIIYFKNADKEFIVKHIIKELIYLKARNNNIKVFATNNRHNELFKVMALDFGLYADINEKSSFRGYSNLRLKYPLNHYF